MLESFQKDTATRTKVVESLLKTDKTSVDSFQEHAPALAGITCTILQWVIYRNLQEVALSGAHYRLNLVHF